MKRLLSVAGQSLCEGSAVSLLLADDEEAGGESVFGLVGDARATGATAVAHVSLNGRSGVARPD
jgi:hypothetical protein